MRKYTREELRELTSHALEQDFFNNELRYYYCTGILNEDHYSNFVMDESDFAGYDNQLQSESFPFYTRFLNDLEATLNRGEKRTLTSYRELHNKFSKRI